MRRQAKLLALVALPLFAGCSTAAPPPKPPVVSYAAKPDFAKVEHDHPLTAAERAAMTPDSFAKLSQEELDQIYARLTAGPIPDGPFQGTIIFAGGSTLKNFGDRPGIHGFLARRAIKDLTELGEFLWKGKVFYRDKRELRNQITERAKLARLFKVPVSQIRTATINGREVGLLFPAKLYCGQSLLDSRRESVIVDYFFGDEIDGYVEGIDQIAGRNGLQIRDEIRMVRPGFYLGRAYLAKIFLLNFTLYNQDVASAGKSHEDCRPGAQQVATTGQ
jgi:hypothetical protein